MAQSVVYADLKFAMAPPLTSPTCHAAPDEDDSPYENVSPAPVPVAPSPGRRPRHWRVAVGLLAASLLLLVATVVALGTCYWQVTHNLQDASREHAAERGRLSQEVRAREQSLEQMRLELAWAMAELQRAWQEGNSSRQELGNLNVKLGHTRQELAVLQEEMQEVQGELRASKSTVSSLRACVNTDCCPSGWVLYRGKCLFISVSRKTWWESRHDCRMKSAQLLVQGNWPTWTLPQFLVMSDDTYWIGAQFSSDAKRTVVWQDSKQLYQPNYSAECGMSANGNIESSKCVRKYQWICEHPPMLSSPSKMFLSFLDKD